MIEYFSTYQQLIIIRLEEIRQVIYPIIDSDPLLPLYNIWMAMIAKPNRQVQLDSLNENVGEGPLVFRYTQTGCDDFKKWSI